MTQQVDIRNQLGLGALGLLHVNCMTLQPFDLNMSYQATSGGVELEILSGISTFSQMTTVTQELTENSGVDRSTPGAYLWGPSRRFPLEIKKNCTNFKVKIC